jgi:hypothetical protein
MQSFQNALTLNEHSHHFQYFTVLFQPHSLEIYIKTGKTCFLTALVIKKRVHVTTRKLDQTGQEII